MPAVAAMSNAGAMARAYIPPLRFHWLTPFYDRLARLLVYDYLWRPILLKQMAIEPGHKVLDIGCGTGTMAVMIKEKIPGAVVIGVDPDAQALGMARDKARAAQAEVTFIQAFADALPHQPPFQEHSFDRIVSTLAFHHLARSQKKAVLKNARRLLKPDGTLFLADWGKAANPFMRLLYYQVQMLDGFGNTADNVEGLLPKLMRDAGFGKAEEIWRTATLFGTFSFYRASP
jgi:ubiquinone/menaquinone biosynthesis C-methylase UbiE